VHLDGKKEEIETFTDEAQTDVFKAPVRTAL
jgi:hypothetical protein